MGTKKSQVPFVGQLAAKKVAFLKDIYDAITGGVMSWRTAKMKYKLTDAAMVQYNNMKKAIEADVDAKKWCELAHTRQVSNTGDNGKRIDTWEMAHIEAACDVSGAQQWRLT